MARVGPAWLLVGGKGFGAGAGRARASVCPIPAACRPVSLPVFQICHMDGNKKLMRTDKFFLSSKCLYRNSVILVFSKSFSSNFQ